MNEIRQLDRDIDAIRERNVWLYRRRLKKGLDIWTGEKLPKHIIKQLKGTRSHEKTCD